MRLRAASDVFRVCPACGIGHGSTVPISRVVSDAELNDRAFLQDVRRFATGLGVKPDAFIDFLLNKFARTATCLVGHDGQPVSLDLRPLDSTNDELDPDNPKPQNDALVDWVKGTLLKPNRALRRRRESLERFRIVATLLRAAFPGEAMMWGVRAANDNSPLIPPSAQ